MGSGTQLVGGDTVIITPTLTVDTAIYAALDIIGGKLTLTNAMRKKAGSGILHSITITDDDNEKAAFDILLFGADLTGTVADQGAYAHSSADLTNFLGRVQVLASDYLTVVTGSLAVVHLRNLAIPVRSSTTSTNLYALIIATGTPTYTAATDLKIRFGILRD